MGRNAAGESFLRGYFQHSTATEHFIQVEKTEFVDQFRSLAEASGRTENINAITSETLSTLSAPGCLYLPGPDLAEHARFRSFYGHANWSICGITHTTATARAMDAIADMLVKPVQAWDALICTSNAVRGNVQKIMEAEAEYLRSRMGATKVTLPQIPVIPLGIITSDFDFSEDQKAQARVEIGAEPNDIVVLFAGRLSFHAKAHPLAMYQAMEEAAKSLPEGVKVHLVECGWHANEVLAKAFADAAALTCPSIRCVTLDGRIKEQRNRAWACADIFCSLSDNIQETFGLVPIEAMAAGLPVIVSDWDGYRDTVRHGVDGYRIATRMPPAGSGSDFAVRHALQIDNYDMYCAYTCAHVEVDVQATKEAFQTLFASAEMRKTMGDAGRTRARSKYDWKSIIGRYEELWGQLEDLRKAGAADVPKLAHPWPQRMDPFESFAGYPSSQLSTETTVTLARSDAVETFNSLWTLYMVNYARARLPEKADLDTVLNLLADGSQSARDLVANFPEAKQPFLFRSLTFLAKLGLVVLD